MLSGIADWVRFRMDAFSTALALKENRAPVNTTYSRVLAYAVDADELSAWRMNFLRANHRRERVFTLFWMAKSCVA